MCVWLYKRKKRKKSKRKTCMHITSVCSAANRAQGVVSELQMSFCSQASCLHLPASELCSLLFDWNSIAWFNGFLNETWHKHEHPNLHLNHHNNIHHPPTTDLKMSPLHIEMMTTNQHMHTRPIEQNSKNRRKMNTHKHMWRTQEQHNPQMSFNDIGAAMHVIIHMYTNITIDVCMIV